MPEPGRKAKRTSIGGQALIEGIMMRGPSKTAMSVRTPGGSIETEFLTANALKDKHKWAGFPVVRGVVGYIEALVFGSRALMRSADIVAEEDGGNEDSGVRDQKAGRDDELPAESAAESSPAGSAPAAELPPAPPAKEREKDPWWYRVLMIGSMALGIGLAIVLFMWLPSVLFDLVNRLAGGGHDKLRALFEGCVKIVLFLAYLAGVSLMPDIKRVFMYHGAEHKTIFAYEAGLPLTVENVRVQKRFHPRCGTSFLVIILAVSILLWTVVSVAFPVLASVRAVWVGVKLLMLPLVCGLGYELIKFCGRRQNLLTRILSAPGMWVQRLTTKEPDDSMIEVGIAAMRGVIPENPDDDRW